MHKYSFFILFLFGVCEVQTKRLIFNKAELPKKHSDFLSLQEISEMLREEEQQRVEREIKRRQREALRRKIEEQERLRMEKVEERQIKIQQEVVKKERRRMRLERMISNPSQAAAFLGEYYSRKLS